VLLCLPGNLLFTLLINRLLLCCRLLLRLCIGALTFLRLLFGLLLALLLQLLLTLLVGLRLLFLLCGSLLLTLFISTSTLLRLLRGLLFALLLQLLLTLLIGLLRLLFLLRSGLLLTLFISTLALLCLLCSLLLLRLPVRLTIRLDLRAVYRLIDPYNVVIGRITVCHRGQACRIGMIYRSILPVCYCRIRMLVLIGIGINNPCRMCVLGPLHHRAVYINGIVLHPDGAGPAGIIDMINRYIIVCNLSYFFNLRSCYVRYVIIHIRVIDNSRIANNIY
jgi:hypothetical protein